MSKGATFRFRDRKLHLVAVELKPHRIANLQGLARVDQDEKMQIVDTHIYQIIAPKWFNNKYLALRTFA